MSTPKIKLYTWGTPNGRKISIALEEMAIPYEVHPINILEGEQFQDFYLKISPGGKIPAIVDPEFDADQPLTVFESGAILIHLARKTGKFWSTDYAIQSCITQWLMWQMGGFGPMLGQLHHFRRYADVELPYAINRYDRIADELYRVLDRRLADMEFVAGKYSIADMAIYPWASRFEWQNIDLTIYPNVKRWFDEISARPQVVRGMKVPFLN